MAAIVTRSREQRFGHVTSVLACEGEIIIFATDKTERLREVIVTATLTARTFRSGPFLLAGFIIVSCAEYPALNILRNGRPRRHPSHKGRKSRTILNLFRHGH